ncbi:MAG: Rap1a/Tai family immunity protein [Rhodospirillaceae bacterium]
MKAARARYRTTNSYLGGFGVALALLAVPAVATAQSSQFKDRDELHRLCASARDFNDGACSGYIIGVIDAAAIFQQKGYCSPDSLSRGAARALVMKWLSEHPRDRGAGAAGAVYNAMVEAFPCPR